MVKVKVVKVGAKSESCMECGKYGTRFRDSDGSHFCSQMCLNKWHGDNGWEPKSSPPCPCLTCESDR